MSKDRLVYLGIAATLAFSGCGPNNESSKATATAVIPQVKPEVDSYYPELRDFPLYASGEFRTQKITKWLNFTQRNFDPAVAQATFNFFEKVATTKGEVEYKIPGQSFSFFPGLRPQSQRVFFIIPENAPVPGWDYEGYYEALTRPFDQSLVSMARLHSSVSTLRPSRTFTTIETAFALSFNTEACQSSVDIGSLSAETALLGQEVFCNSYGAAFTTRQYGINYQDYFNWAASVQIRKNPSSPYFPLYILPTQEYNQIPVVGSLIR